MESILSLFFIIFVSIHAEAQDESVKDQKKASEKNSAKDHKDTTIKTGKRADPSTPT